MRCMWSSSVHHAAPRLPLANERMKKSRLQLMWSSVQVKSCADGSMSVLPEWVGIRKYTPEDGGGPGLGARLAAAKTLEHELNKILRS